MNIQAAPFSKPVLFFIIPSLKGGGAERVIISLANYFNKNNFQSVLISLNNDVPAYEIDDDVKVFYLTDRQKSSFIYRLYHIAETFLNLSSYCGLKNRCALYRSLHPPMFGLALPVG
ncbi:hypothetical protein ACQ86K_19320 [Mucilaginibacter sp. P19]|uniref:hypothetical protein n=1 Tax=Mucilaginibacter sp. P19 TaxID=3423947 RepID=UPI003D67F7D0